MQCNSDVPESNTMIEDSYQHILHQIVYTYHSYTPDTTQESLHLECNCLKTVLTTKRKIEANIRNCLSPANKVNR
uniref:THAP domaincontaining protein 6like [Xiphosphorus maculatus] n=1 Tax=Lepeophtheirus salmonis TaxID=72036 RepID=A0A0K2U248_LEPSM